MHELKVFEKFARKKDNFTKKLRKLYEEENKNFAHHIIIFN
jgi:hypothetical protein